jgi:F-type H+-transporting ATPase subunit epsilon
MKLIIVTPTQKFFEGEANEVYAPGVDGDFGVLNGHAPFLTTLRNGDIRVVLADNSKKTFKITGGLADISNNEVKILAEAVEV